MVAARLNLKDARAYLMTVKNKLQDKRDTYNTFLKVMNDFKARKVDRSGVRSSVKELFKEHQELLEGFNTFLPNGFEITLEGDKNLPKGPDYGDAVDFINKVKARFQSNERAYYAFLRILGLYTKKKKSIVEVYHEVLNVLFRDHYDLRVEFVQFLPRCGDQE